MDARLELTDWLDLRAAPLTCGVCIVSNGVEEDVEYTMDSVEHWVDDIVVAELSGLPSLKGTGVSAGWPFELRFLEMDSGEEQLFLSIVSAGLARLETDAMIVLLAGEQVADTDVHAVAGRLFRTWRSGVYGILHVDEQSGSRGLVPRVFYRHSLDQDGLSRPVLQEKIPGELEDSGDLSAGQLAQVEEAAGELLRELGYCGDAQEVRKC